MMFTKARLIYFGFCSNFNATLLRTYCYPHNYHSLRNEPFLKCLTKTQPSSKLLNRKLRLAVNYLCRPHQKLERYLKNTSFQDLCNKFNLHDDHSFLQLIKEKDDIEDNLKQLHLLKTNEGKKQNKEMLELIEDDIQQYTVKLNELFEEIIERIVPKDDFENCNDIVLEISAGVGGMEAMLFSSELRDMYCGFLDFKGWKYSLAENDESEIGGVRHCSLLVSGPGVYKALQHEAGVHRVQRVPVTERGGRIHTSTVSVAILPQPSDVEVNLKDSDLKIETKRASGAGGQHVNTTDSAVRVTHLPTGIVVECQAGRSQIQNKATALKRLQAKIYERELAQIDSSIRTQRKLQIGTSSRSEKIRTYNYRDDRISDHRLSMNVHNLREFLQGGEPLDKLLTQLQRSAYDLQVRQFIESLPL